MAVTVGETKKLWAVGISDDAKKRNAHINEASPVVAPNPYDIKLCIITMLFVRLRHGAKAKNMASSKMILLVLFEVVRQRANLLSSHSVLEMIWSERSFM